MKKPRKKISATSGQIGKSARAIYQIDVQELLAGFLCILGSSELFGAVRSTSGNLYILDMKIGR